MEYYISTTFHLPSYIHLGDWGGGGGGGLGDYHYKTNRMLAIHGLKLTLSIRRAIHKTCYFLVTLF